MYAVWTPPCEFTCLRVERRRQVIPTSIPERYKEPQPLAEGPAVEELYGHLARQFPLIQHVSLAIHKDIL